MSRYILATLLAVMVIGGGPVIAIANYEVKITNLTKGQSFTPILVATHMEAFTLFTAGYEASDALTMLAETGDTGPMTMMLQDSGMVSAIRMSEGLLGPGDHVTMHITGDDAHRYLSLAAMLIPTNDAFVAVRGMKLPKNGNTRTATGVAYDAGSETNNERCASIPGPPCNGEASSPSDGGEGFIHVHSGIHGVGDLFPKDWDWRGPVVGVKVTHIPTANCNGIERDIVFAGLDWDSPQFQNHVAGTILKDGFGCDYTDIPGSTIPLVEQLVSGDIDIKMELWTETVAPIFWEAVTAGEVLDLGLNMQGIEHSFLVPRYVLEGDASRGIAPMAPNLRSVADLASHAAVFNGLYHNCIVGWQCEGVNTDKLATYGLDMHFTNFRPADGQALSNSLAEAYQAGGAWLGYYWAPSWELGTFDMVALEEPPHSESCWVDGNRGCAFPPSNVHIAVSKGFAEIASPEMLQFLRDYTLDQRIISEMLAYMRANNTSVADAARYFLETREDVWTTWVSDDVAARVQDALN